MPLAEGAEAPAFTLPAGDGTARSLAELTAGGPALLAFFKTSCPTCQLAFPVYGELERRYGDVVPVVAVSQSPLGTTVPWLAAHGFAGPALDDERGGYRVSARYRISTVPTLVVVVDGRVSVTSEAWDRDRANAWGR